MKVIIVGDVAGDASCAGWNPYGGTRRHSSRTRIAAFRADQASASWRTVGGKATPAARGARLAAGRGGERRRSVCRPARHRFR